MKKNYFKGVLGSLKAGRYDKKISHDLLAYRTEDEVGMVLGHEVILDLRTLQETLAEQSSRSDCDLRLVDVEVDTLRIVDDSEERVDSVLLVLFEYRVEASGSWSRRRRFSSLTLRDLSQLWQYSLQYLNHSRSVPGLQKNSSSICSNSLVLNVKLPGVISLRKDLPT